MGLAFNLAVLSFWKYTPMILCTLAQGAAAFNLPAVPQAPQNWLIPFGISFYAFAGVGYMVDVYRRRTANVPCSLLPGRDIRTMTVARVIARHARQFIATAHCMNLLALVSIRPAGSGMAAKAVDAIKAGMKVRCDCVALSQPRYRSNEHGCPSHRARC